MLGAYSLISKIAPCSYRAASSRLRTYIRKGHVTPNMMIRLRHPTNPSTETPFLTYEGAVAVYKAMRVRASDLEAQIERLYELTPQAQPAPPKRAREDSSPDPPPENKDTELLCARIKRYRTAHEVAGIDLSTGPAKDKFEAWVHTQAIA